MDAISPDSNEDDIFHRIDELFEGLPAHLQRYVSSSVDVDGMETLGHLFVVEKFMSEQLLMDLEEEPTIEHLASVDVSAVNDLVQPSKISSEKVDTNSYNTNFTSKVLKALRRLLIKRLETYVVNQMHWITDQVADPKKAGVFVPLLKLPLFIDQIFEMTGGMYLKYVEDIVQKLCKRLFVWLDSTVAQNEKYADAAKILNYSFFEESFRLRQIKCIEPLVTQASQITTEALNRYLDWMLSYELPLLVEVGNKVDLASTKIGRESGGLELYIKRWNAYLSVITLYDCFVGRRL